GAACGEVKVFPARSRCAHLAGDAFACRWIAQPAKPRLEAALLDPGRHRRIETGRARGVGVHVRRDGETCGAGLFDPLDHRRQLAPIGSPRLLPVVVLGRYVGAAWYLDELLVRLGEAMAFGAEM